MPAKLEHTPIGGRGRFYELLEQLAETHECSLRDARADTRPTPPRSLTPPRSRDSSRKPTLNSRGASKDLPKARQACIVALGDPIVALGESFVQSPFEPCDPLNGDVLNVNTGLPQNLDLDVVFASPATTPKGGARQNGTSSYAVEMCSPELAEPPAAKSVLRRSSSKISNQSENRRTATVSATCHNFHLRPLWSQEIPSITMQRKISFSRIKSQKSIGSTKDLHCIRGDSCLQPYIWHPACKKRLFWDLCSMAMLMYDILVIPFRGSFNPVFPSFFVAVTWIIMLFWTVDMFVSMMTGYQRERLTILDPRLIVRHYIVTWFPLDIVIVGLDWTLVGLGEGESGGAARLGRSLRSLRFVRTLRLIRVLKLKRIIHEIQDRINTEAVSICFGILKIILFLFVSNHLVACCWYAVGMMDREDGESSWVIEAKMAEATLPYKYFTSLHWSMTQFTPASMEVVPVNVDERICSVIVLFFAMITFSSFVSILTASMARLSNLRNDESRQFWLLRRYLRDWGVSVIVGTRVQKYLEFAYAKQRSRVQERDVALFSLLSEPLRDELRHEIFSLHISCHILFSNCGERTFARALKSASLARGDVLFACGEIASAMTFAAGGAMEYTLGLVLDEAEELDPTTPSISKTAISLSDLMPDHQPVEVSEGQWLSEAVLWTPWVHVGDLTAISECQVILLDAEGFLEAVQTNRPLWQALRQYARVFLEELNKIDGEDLTDVTSFSAAHVYSQSNFAEIYGVVMADLNSETETPVQVLARNLEQWICKFRPWKRRHSGED